MTDDLPRDRDEAVDALFRLHAGSLLQVAVLLVGDESTAREAVLDAFADLRVRGRYRDSLEALDGLRASLIRGARRREPAADDLLAPLSRRQREVFVLRWWSGLSETATGEFLRRSPRVVARTYAEARRALPAEEDFVQLLEAQAAEAELSYDAEERLHERIHVVGRCRRRRIGAATFAAVLLLVAAVGGVLATRPRPYSSPTGRPVFAAVVPVADLATFDVRTGRPSGKVSLAQAEAVASVPGGGWLVSRSDTACRSILTTVRLNGSTQQVGEPLDGQLANLAVSPDGRYAAAAASLCSSVRLIRLDVIDLRKGALIGEWVPPPGATSISGLSWAPDSRRLAYTLGTGVGGGGSGYTLLDTRSSGIGLAPTDPLARDIAIDGRSCQVVRSLWLGRTGRFAVFASCLDRNELLLIQVPPQPPAVQRGTVIATLPGSALTLGLDAAVTGDGRHLLVTTDVATYRIDDSKVTRLADTRPSPAW